MVYNEIRTIKKAIKNVVEINYKNKEICNVEPQTQLLHPITLKMINLRRQNIPLCLTKFDVDAESKLSSIISFQKCKTNTNNYKK